MFESKSNPVSPVAVELTNLGLKHPLVNENGEMHLRFKETFVSGL